MKIRLVFLLFLPIIGVGQSKNNTNIALLDGRVFVSVPKELSEMSSEMWTKKYGQTQRPVMALSDADIEVSLVGQYTNQKWDEKDIAEYKDFRIENIKKTRSDVDFLKDGVVEVHGKKVGFIKFRSQAIGAKIFNYYFFTVVDGKVLIFNFNCIESLRNTWETVADGIVNSLTVK